MLFFFHTKSLEYGIQFVVNIPSQFEIATFQVVYSYVWLVATSTVQDWRIECMHILSKTTLACLQVNKSHHGKISDLISLLIDKSPPKP